MDREYIIVNLRILEESIINGYYPIIKKNDNDNNIKYWNVETHKWENKEDINWRKQIPKIYYI